MNQFVRQKQLDEINPVQKDYNPQQYAKAKNVEYFALNGTLGDINLQKLVDQGLTTGTHHLHQERQDLFH